MVSEENTLPFNAAAERNKVPIAECLRRVIQPDRCWFEIGSGTGQHARWMTRALSIREWQTSETPEGISVLQNGLAMESSEALPPPQVFSVGDPVKFGNRYDYVYSANTAHIMPRIALPKLFSSVNQLLKREEFRSAGSETAFFLYGPFSEGGIHNSVGNQNFDQSLRQQGYGGIPDLDDLRVYALNSHLILERVIDLPANNRLLIFGR